MSVAARIPFRAARETDDPVCGLTFDLNGGPLVAVCGLTGGSGASTLALSLARQAARESKAPVLLTESDTPRGGLAVLAGQGTALSLPDLAARAANGETSEPPFVELEPRLRLLAAQPQLRPYSNDETLGTLLRAARDAHGLVIVDCGTGWAAAAPVLEAATHIVWTLPASQVALVHGSVMFASGMLPKPGRWLEVLAVTDLKRYPDTTARALRRLARHRCERLILIPYCDPIAHGDLARPGMAMTRALAGFTLTLRRPRER